MLLVAAVVERRAVFAVVLLACPFSNAAIKVNVGRVELLLAWLQGHVQSLDQSSNFLTIEVAAVVVQVVQVGRVVVLQFVVPAFDSPDVRPVRRGRMLRTEKIERT